MPRVLLGRCLHGKLILKPSRRSQGVDLYWHGDSLVGAFNEDREPTFADPDH